MMDIDLVHGIKCIYISVVSRNDYDKIVDRVACMVDNPKRVGIL